MRIRRRVDMRNPSKSSKLRSGHTRKISSIHPHLRNVVNAILESHGVDAKVHSIAYVSKAAKIVSVGCHMEGPVWVC